VAVGLCSLANLRADDYLNKFKAKAEVDAQKTLSDVKGLLDQAFKVRNTNPQAARVLLTDGLSRLDNANSVSDADRAAMRKQIQTRLNEINVLVREQTAQAALETKRAEEKAIKDLKFKAQSGQGGQSTYDQAKGFIGNNNKTLGTLNDIKLRTESASNQVAMEIYKSNAIMTEQRFRPGFETLADKRPTGPKLTAEEKKLIKALNSTLSVNFNKIPMKEAIEYIQEKTDGLNIFLDDLALKEKGIEYDSDPVTFKANKVTVRTILKKIFADRGLTFIIKEATVQVMDPQKASEMLVVRTYPVQDLIQPVVSSPNPYMNRAQMIQAVQGLVLNIMNAVEPASWQVNGGKGTISFNEVTKSLVIRQTAEFHYQMSGLLR
jgi:hypothetical protein